MSKKIDKSYKHYIFKKNKKEKDLKNQLQAYYKYICSLDKYLSR